MSLRKFLPPASSSEAYDPSTDTYPIDFYYASKDAFRAAPPGNLALPWPYDRSRPSAGSIAVSPPIENACRQILQDHGIALYRMQMHGLSPRGLFRPQDTLVISTHDQETRSWGAAAGMVQEKLRGVYAAAAAAIRVEIRNEEMMYRDVSSIVVPDLPAHATCQAAEPLVCREVQESCSGVWTTISYHMRGPVEQREGRRATVLISITPGVRRKWALIEAKIRSVVAHLDIDVELVPGSAILSKPSSTTTPSPPPPLVLRNLTPSPVNGSSVCARRNRHPSR